LKHNMMKNISSIAIAVIFGISVMIGDSEHDGTKIYGSFSMTIADLSTLPDHSSKTGEFLLGLVFPKGKIPYYCNVVARRGKKEQTFQVGLRATKFNEVVFSETSLSVNSPCNIVF
jgi:hypothetical protein